MSPACLRNAFLSTGILLLPVSAHAHGGAASAGEGFLAGFLHPLTGLDHLLAILAVGVVAARRGGSDLWRIPLVFAGMLMAGAAISPAIPAWPSLEIAVGLSAAALWLWAVAFANRGWLATGAVLSSFALIHGVPHGWELSGGGLSVAALAGAFSATFVLGGLTALVLVRIGSGMTRRTAASRTAQRAGR